MQNASLRVNFKATFRDFKRHLLPSDYTFGEGVG